MPRAKFRCNRCKRSFKMAAHLARHMNTIHAGKQREASTTAASRKGKRRVGRPKGVGTVAAARSRLGTFPTFPIMGDGTDGIIEAMRDHHGELLAQRTSLDAQIDAFARAIETIGAAPSRATRRTGKKRGRPAGPVGRTGSLKDYIVRVLRQSSKPMSPRDIGAGVRKAGFKTKAKDLSKAVSNTLPDLKNVKRVGFGVYQISGGR